MRASAYIKAIEQAKQLPTDIPELRLYFRDGYNPQAAALDYIITKARRDSNALSPCEFFDVYKTAQRGAK